MPIQLTRELAWRAGMDAGNRSMHAGKRTAWNEDDYNTAAHEFNRLWPSRVEADEATRGKRTQVEPF